MPKMNEFNDLSHVGVHECIYNHSNPCSTSMAGMLNTSAELFRPWYCHRVHGTMVRHTGGYLNDNVVYTHLQSTDCDCTPPLSPVETSYRSVRAVGGIEGSSKSRPVKECGGVASVSVVVVPSISDRWSSSCEAGISPAIIPVVHPLSGT